MSFTTKKYQSYYRIEKIQPTQELKIKHLRGETREPIDILLLKGLITKEQQQAAHKLRFLFNLEFGPMQIRAYNLRERGKANLTYSDQYIIRKRKQYLEAVELLKKNSLFNSIVNLCIFNLHPRLLCQVINYQDNKALKIEMEARNYELQQISLGLDILVNLFFYGIANKGEQQYGR